MKRLIIIGDKTSHGGVVITASTTIFIQGKKVAKIGDLVACPACKGVYAIVQGRHDIISGSKVAAEGMKVSCGASLIASQNEFF